MPEAFGPAYQLTLQGTIFDQTFVNVFHYVVYEGTGDEADALGVAFKIGVLPNICGIQNVAVEYQTLTVNGERDSTDIAVIDIADYLGVVSGDCLPPFVAWAYTINRSSTQMRNGYKRFPGVTETWQTNGEVATGTPKTTVEALGADIKADLELEGGLIAPLCVPKRQWHNVPITPTEFWVPADVNFAYISSQSSRKFNR